MQNFLSIRKPKKEQSKTEQQQEQQHRAELLKRFSDEERQQKWFQFEMNREDAEELLKRSLPGDFLIRNSSSRGFIAISFISLKKPGLVQHSRVEVSSQGFLVPERPTKVYPNLTKLLESVPEIVIGPVSDRNLAILAETFPNKSQDDLLAALRMARNDVEMAVQMLMPKHSSKYSPGSVLGSFLSLNMNEVQDPETVKFANLRRKMTITTKVLQKLQEDVQIVLRNPDHPMGKKFYMFGNAFNTTVSAGTLDDSILEIREFAGAMQKTIMDKLKLQSGTDDETLVWKVTSNVIFESVWDGLRKAYSDKFAKSFTEPKQHLLDVLRPVKLKHYRGVSRMNLSFPSKPFERAIELFSTLSWPRNLTEKLEILMSTVESIVSDINTINSGFLPKMLLNDWIPLFSYCAAHSNMDQLYVEVKIMHDFFPRCLRYSQEGLAFAILNCSMSYLDNFVNSTLVELPSEPDTPERDLITFDN